MPRYIDADEALRMIRNSKQDCPFDDDKKSVWDVDHDCAISCVDATPTADVVEVVRCKDCGMSRETADERYLFCMQFADTVNCQAFCSYGTPKEIGEKRKE